MNISRDQLMSWQEEFKGLHYVQEQGIKSRMLIERFTEYLIAKASVSKPDTRRYGECVVTKRSA